MGLTGRKTLVSPIETTLGAAMFGEDNIDRNNEEEYLQDLAMDQLMQSNGVVSGGLSGEKVRPKRVRHLKRLQKQLGKQYTKYGARWLVAVNMLIWGGCALAIGIICKSSNNAAVIMIFMPLRFVMGCCNGVVVVSSQSLIAKEVPPARGSLASSLLGWMFPVGSMCGLTIAFYGRTEDTMMSLILWIGVGGLSFFCLLIIWLVFYIENAGDQSDLLEHKDLIIAPVRGEEAKIKKGCCKKCCRLSSRVCCFSWLGSIWLMKFGSIRSMALFNLFWTFSVMSVSTWVPTLIYDSVLFFDDISPFVDVAQFKDQSPEYIRNALALQTILDRQAKGENPSPPYDESDPTDQVVTDASTVDEILALFNALPNGTTVETVGTVPVNGTVPVDTTVPVTVPDVKSQEDLQNELDSIMKALANLKRNGDRRLTEEKEETFFYHNIAATSAVNKVDAEAQLLMWSGMSVSTFFSIVIIEFALNSLSPYVANAIGVIVGTIAPATLSIYVALAMIKLDAVSYGDQKEFRSYLFLIIPAMLLTGFALPPLFTSQNWIAPKKAGTTFSVISVAGTVGDLIASLCSFVLPILTGHLGIGYYCVTCVCIGAGLFMSLVFYFCGNMDSIPELSVLADPELNVKAQDIEMERQIELN